MAWKTKLLAMGLAAAGVAMSGCGKMDDKCKAVTCATGETCNPATGVCEGPADLCQGVSCSAGQMCDSADGLCKAIDKCKLVTCSNGQSCDPADGVCKAPPTTPSITKITPSLGPTIGGTTVSIEGTGFKGASVQVGNLAIANASVDAAFTKITFVSPPNLGKGGDYDVVVKNSDNLSSTLSKGFRYHYNNVTHDAATSVAWTYAPRQVLFRDLDGDGKQDIITVNANNVSTTGSLTRSVSVALGNGDGTFKTKTDYVVGNTDAAGYPFMAAFGDVDGDNTQDLVTVNQKDRSLSFLKGKSDGTFVAAMTQAANTLPADAQGLVVGDYNKDGKVDIITANNGAANITIFKGTGAWPPPAGTNMTVAANPYSIIAADFNKDTYPDLAITHNNGTLSILINKADATLTFNTPVTITGLPSTLYTVVSGDWDGNGNVDLAVAGANTGQVVILMNNGSGTFTAQSDKPSVGGQPQQIVAEDINGDRILDLVTTNFTSATVSVLKGDGTGKFVANTPATFSTGASTAPNSVGVVDLNGDRRMDLVTTSYNIAAGMTTGTFRVLLSNSQ